ncbi:GNAT family N-acetyltransferase [Pseudarthrobacter sp. B907]|uniref:GNAT family N-acetyltransferase n=1 Tax=Pseudarthrobacter sp. B907 TaxID=3158261 RepID=UPI0032DA87C4
MAFTLREPTLPDAPLIAELHVATWREAYSHLLPEGFFTAEYVQGRHLMWNQILENPRPDWTIRIAEHNAQIIGFGVAGPSYGAEGQDLPRDRQLFSLYVSAEHYGTGVGQGLLDASVGDAAAMLWVAKDNPRAIAFYRRNGFAFDGTEQIDPGAPRIVDARMVR